MEPTVSFLIELLAYVKSFLFVPQYENITYKQKFNLGTEAIARIDRYQDYRSDFQLHTQA